jgi:hypothetical protein
MRSVLTKEDLIQIGNLVRTEIQTEIAPLKADVHSLKLDVGKLKVDVRSLKSDVKKIRKDINVIVSSFDSDYIELRTRVESIEDHLGISS